MAGGVAALALAYAVPEATWERLLSIREEVARGTMSHRKLIWEAGWKVFSDNWLIGVGVGMYPLAVESLINWRIVAHNTPLSVATELGVVGLMLFFSAPVETAIHVRTRPRAIRALVWGLLVTWLVGTSSLSWEYRKTTWFVFAITLALAVPLDSGKRRRLRAPALANPVR